MYVTSYDQMQVASRSRSMKSWARAGNLSRSRNFFAALNIPSASHSASAMSSTRGVGRRTPRSIDPIVSGE